MNYQEFFFWFKKIYKHKKIWQNFLHFLMWQIDSSEYKSDVNGESSWKLVK